MAAPAPGEARVGPGQQVNDIYVRIKIIHSTKRNYEYFISKTEIPIPKLLQTKVMH